MLSALKEPQLVKYYEREREAVRDRGREGERECLRTALSLMKW
jgi:hypothetical protein